MRDAADSNADAGFDAGIHVVADDAAEFPRALRALRDAPRRIWVAGVVPARPAIAIVGSRAATPYGTRFARRLAADLAGLGYVIVSGLARGIDAAAHLGALEAEGLTAAVIPSGLDQVTPAHHRDLAARIAQRGAVLSELATGGPRSRGEFVRRNRLIAAWGEATVVVEAAERSGALSTARVAKMLGRPVLAVPGDVDRSTSRGCHALLRAGARLCEGVADVVAALGAPVSAKKTAAEPATGFIDAAPPDAGSVPSRVLEALAAGPLGLDALVARSGCDATMLLAELTRLEWSGLVVVDPGSRWRRAQP